MPAAYDEAIDFLAGGMTPEQLVAFKPSAAACERLEFLIRKEKTDGLLPDELGELNYMMEIEHVLSLAKAVARQKLAQRSIVRE
jgi:hypothetical protein